MLLQGRGYELRNKSDLMDVPHQQHPGLDVGHVPVDKLILVSGVVRDHLEMLLISELQAFDVDVVILEEEVDPVTHKLADVDVHDQWGAVLDGGVHRLAPPGDHLQVIILFEFNTQLMEMARTDADVFQ